MLEKITLESIIEKVSLLLNQIATVVKSISSEAITWLSIVLLNSATMPSMLALMSGYSGEFPPIDLVLIVWISLILLLLRAAIIKNILQMFTIGIGFAMQAASLALIFFK